MVSRPAEARRDPVSERGGRGQRSRRWGGELIECGRNKSRQTKKSYKMWDEKEVSA